MLGTVAVLVVIAAGAWVWMETLRVRETAEEACRALCRSQRVQFLDDTIALTYLGLGRGGLRAAASGSVSLRRVYQFEFSRFGHDRERGSVTMNGRQVEGLYLPEAPVDPS